MVEQSCCTSTSGGENEDMAGGKQGEGGRRERKGWEGGRREREVEGRGRVGR